MKTDRFQYQTIYIRCNLARQVKWLFLSLTTGLSGNSKSFISGSSWLNQCLCMMYLWIANTCCLQAKQCFYLFAYFWPFNHSTGCCKSHLLTIICWHFMNRKVVWLMKSDTQRLLSMPVFLVNGQLCWTKAWPLLPSARSTWNAKCLED